MSKEVIKNCYQRSIELLLNNSTEFGVLAAALQACAKKRNYLSVFARDAAICSLGMVASGNKKLIRIAKKSLLTLVKYQSQEGEIPNYVKPKKNYVDFWRMECIDASLWWLLAIKFFDKNSKEKNKLETRLKRRIDRAIFWLECQMHPEDKLLLQNEASDWADLMPRTGKVLYTNALWYQVNKVYNLKNKKKIKANFNNLFYPFDNKGVVLKSERKTVTKILRTTKAKDYYLSFVNYLFWGKEVDVYGNSLAVLFALPNPELRKKIVKYFLKKNRLTKLPLPVVFNPIKESSSLWRDYMKEHKQNYPYQYHNGGIWPFASCFWAMALSQVGQKQAAIEELERIAYANQLGDWRFSEWLHAQTGELQGMHGQSWNAGAFLLAFHYLQKDIKI